MGEFIHNVSIVTKVSSIHYHYKNITFGINRYIYGILIHAGNNLLGVPILNRIRYGFYKIAHWIYGWDGLPSVRIINGFHYIETPLGDAAGRRILIDLGVKDSLSIKPVYARENGSYVLAHAYFDGGSDGSDEYEYFSRGVDAYFSQKGMCSQ